MTVEKVTQLTRIFLTGDNSKAEVTPILIETAIGDVCRYCTPQKLVTAVAEGSDAPDTYFRQIDDGEDETGAIYHRYIVVPQIDETTTEIEVEEELIKAIAYFLCSYLTNKEPDGYIMDAKSIIAVYNANRLYE